MRLENKVALISGGARGMGGVEARLFAKEGAKVVIGDIREEEGRQIEAQIAEAGGECLFIFLDVTKEANWAEAVESTVGRHTCHEAVRWRFNNQSLLHRWPGR